MTHLFWTVQNMKIHIGQEAVCCSSTVQETEAAQMRLL